MRNTTATGTFRDFEMRKIYTKLENEGLQGYIGDSVPFITQTMIPYFEKTEDYEKCKFLRELADRAY
jgi:hypothetical protein